MTMSTQISPATGSGDCLRDPLSRVSLSRSSSGDSLFLEEKKSGDAADILMSATKTFEKMRTPAGERKEYRNMISSEPGSKFLPEKGRYRLYVSRECPQSHLALLMLNLKGLNSNGTISVVYVHPHSRDSLECQWIIDDSFSTNNDSFASLKSEESQEFTSIRDIYQNEPDGNNENISNSNSIPLLYDTTHQTIVNNNAQDICNMFKSSFHDFAAAPLHDNIPPKDDSDKLQLEIREWLYPLLSTTPSTVPPYLYSFHPQEMDAALKRAIHILKQQRYLTSSTHITEADLRLFVTLLRYDQVYALHLSQPPRLMQEAALLDYCRDIYQQPGVAETVNLQEIQAHFVGPHAIVGTSGKAMLDALKMPHQRHLM